MTKDIFCNLQLHKSDNFHLSLVSFWKEVYKVFQPNYSKVLLSFPDRTIEPYTPELISFEEIIQKEINITFSDGNHYSDSIYINKLPEGKIEVVLRSLERNPKILQRFFFNIITNTPHIVQTDCDDAGSNGVLQEKYKALGRQKGLNPHAYHWLYWLNFLNHEEAARHGGDALLELPFATRTEKLETGIFIQIGDSPEDVHTAEGKERLCRAMHWVYGLISLGRPLTQSEMDAFEMPPEIEYVAPNVLPHEELPPGIKAIFNSASSFDDEEEEDTP